MRFYDVDFGRITLDGVDIREWSVGELRRQMGLVMQEPILFNYTVYENILYGNMQASNKEILEAAFKANVMEFIERFKYENDIENIDKSYTLLREEVEKYKQEIIPEFGEKEFKTVLEYITRYEEEEINTKGKFEAIEGIIDYRDESLKEVRLNDGFYKACGVRGNRLSGGQK